MYPETERLFETDNDFDLCDGVLLKIGDRYGHMIAADRYRDERMILLNSPAPAPLAITGRWGRGSRFAPAERSLPKRGFQLPGGLILSSEGDFAWLSEKTSDFLPGTRVLFDPARELDYSQGRLNNYSTPVRIREALLAW